MKKEISNKINASIAFGIITAISALLFYFGNPLNKFVFKCGGYGIITKGTVGFVSIGQDFTTADQKLKELKLTPNASQADLSDTGGGLFQGHRVPIGARESCYDDSTWRRGTFCISNKDGKVASIAWAYQPGIYF